MKKRIIRCVIVCFMLGIFLLQAVSVPQKGALIQPKVIPTNVILQKNESVKDEYTKFLIEEGCVSVKNRDIVTASYQENITFYPIENGNTQKTYEPYQKKNGKSAFADWSDQYKIQQMAETDEYGLRVIDGRYCVAVGSYFDMKIGQKFDIALENGTEIPCIMSDLKDDDDTDRDNLFTVHSKCMAEFIVSIKDLPEMVQLMGNVSYVTDTWNSKIVSIVVYDENIL